jgi:hypothetical protein
MILVDIPVWLPALRHKTAPERREVAELLERDEAATIDVIVAGVLQGASDDEDFRKVAYRLDALHYFHADESIWYRAGELSFNLKRRGLRTPLADIVTALVALEHDLELYAKDDHFNRIDGLKLHRVQA